MIRLPNAIIIGSTGRNTGKTEFSCRLIQRLSKKHQIIGFKVVAIEPSHGNCPRGGNGCGICSSLKKDFEIIEETELNPSKDTCRMLIAGAHKVYLLKVRVDKLEEGVQAMIKYIPENALAVCESNSLRKVIEPALFIVIKNLLDKTIKESCAEVINYANKIIEFDNMAWNFEPERVSIKNQTWIVKEKATAIILAGGKSSRMGEDKSFLKVNGLTLIETIVKQLEDHFDEIIIGANDPEKYKFLNLSVIADEEKDKGPLMGIYSCLKSSSNEINFVTACDIPIMNTKLIHNMISISGKVDIVIPVKDEDKHEPLFAIYKKNSVIPEAEKIIANNKRRVIELLNNLKFTTVDFNDQNWYQNLNVRDEYIEYIKTVEQKNCYRE